MTSTTWKAASLGALTGMRSMAAAALIAEHASDEDTRSRRFARRLRPGHAVEDAARRKRVAHVLELMAAGEVVADKLPGIGARTDAAPLFARAAMGALVGVAIAELENHERTGPALIGAAAAVAGATGAYYGRRWLKRRYDLPDLLLGVAEDAFVFGAGRMIVTRME